jgi:hypothetical protein
MFTIKIPRVQQLEFLKELSYKRKGIIYKDGVAYMNMQIP